MRGRGTVPRPLRAPGLAMGVHRKMPIRSRNFCGTSNLGTQSASRNLSRGTSSLRRRRRGSHHPAGTRTVLDPRSRWDVPIALQGRSARARSDSWVASVSPLRAIVSLPIRGMFWPRKWFKILATRRKALPNTHANTRAYDSNTRVSTRRSIDRNIHHRCELLLRAVSRLQSAQPASRRRPSCRTRCRR